MPTSRHQILKSMSLSLLVVVLGDFAHALSSGSNAERPKRLPQPISAHDLSSATEDTILKTSSALAGIGEVDVARRILKQRSSRRRTSHVPPDLTKRTHLFRQVQQTSKRKIMNETPQRKASTPPSSKRAVSSTCGIDLPYESAIQALRVYHEQHSHLVMPRVYLVEDEINFPKEWHGLDLAGTVYDMKWWIRHVKEQPERVAELNKLGFVWERLQPEWNLVLEALITYRTLNNNLLVPAKFVVPFGDKEWSRSTWGISLGKVVYRIRSRGDFIRGPTSLKRRQQLESLGFVWDVSERLFDILCSALRIYSKVEAVSGATSKRLGALKIPARYVVPESEAWPRELWGYPLGAKCTAVRQKELYVKDRPERLKELADIGYHVGGNDSLKWLEVVHAAAVYSQMHGRHLDVPQDFVVPAPPTICISDNSINPSHVVGSDDAWPWPEYLWGFPLGQRLRDVRLKGYYLRGEASEARRRQLDALGFNWNPKKGPRKKPKM